MAEQGDDGFSSLPMDIIETILSRLPAKSLVRFKALSRTWKNLISDVRFIRTHLQQSKNSSSRNLFLAIKSAANPSEKHSLIRYEDRKFRTEAVLRAPDGWNWDGAVLCSCNGVVLLSDVSFRVFLLWNPSIRKTTKFWFHYNHYGGRNYGVCHDPTIDDFKVILVSENFYAVYSCKTKSWMKRSCSAMGIKKLPGLFLDGAVYWDRMRKEEWGCYGTDIIYFDSRGDELKMLQKPEDLKNTDEVLLIGLRDRLCLWLNNEEESVVRIWMKEQGRDQNSWMHYMTIDDFPTPVCSYFKPVYFQENEIVIHLEDAIFLIYFPCEKTFEEFEDDELLKTRLVPYVDSFLFFPVEKALPQRKRNRRIAN